jgi:hypothetical protein
MSLCLNVALAGVAVCLLKQPVPPGSRESAATISEPATASAIACLPAASSLPATVAYVTNRFAWSAVEAEDFEQLAANLRAIGCPEKTVRDVVVARARRGLEQLSPRAKPKLAFWMAGVRRAQAQREAERERAETRAMILARAEHAVGRDVSIEDGKMTEDLVEQAVVRFVSGPMPEETFWRVACLLVRQEARRDEIRARTQGVWLEEDEAIMKDLGRQFYGELAAVLRPAELEEFTARVGMMKLTDEVRFEATDLNLAEIRQVALIRARFDDPAMEEWFDHGSSKDQREAQVAQAVREFLGESRYAQVERAADSDFKTLFDLGRDHHLPREAAVKAFELRQLTGQEVARLRADLTLSEAERQQQLAQIQTQVQAGVSKVLGEAACTHYLNQGGAWLTNISGL